MTEAQAEELAIQRIYSRGRRRTPSPSIASATGVYGLESAHSVLVDGGWRSNQYVYSGGNPSYIIPARAAPHDPNGDAGQTGGLGPPTTNSAPNGAWSSCVKALREHDRHLVQGWKEDVDSLLVFSGLFSAVVTAFNIEAYKLLQEDPDETTATLLSRILAAQLATDSGNTPHALPPPKTTFQPDTRSVRINILWFSSLVLSLVSASIGILTKQWLREYTRTTASSPRESARILQFRHEAFVRWKVPLTIALLPILLQVAMVLFFTGLLELLWSLSTPVAGVITVIVAISLSFLVLTTVMPTFRGDCPYKSPQALGIYLVMQGLVRGFTLLALRVYSWCGWNRPIWPLMIDPSSFRRWKRRLAEFRVKLLKKKFFRSWYEREMAIVQDSADRLDHRVLADADVAFMRDDFLSQTISACLKDVECPAAMECLQEIIAHRADTVHYGVPQWHHRDTIDGGVTLLLHLLLDVLPRMDYADHANINKMLAFADSLCRAIPFEVEHPDTVILYQRLFEVLVKFLTCERSVQTRSFSLMNSMWTRSNAPIGPTVIHKLISFARTAKQSGDLPTFHTASQMTLAFSIAATLPRPAYDSVKNDLLHLIADLEGYLTDAGTAQSASILLALVELDEHDPALISSPKLRGLLNSIKATGPRLPEAEQLSSIWRLRLEYARQQLAVREQHPAGSIDRRRNTVMARANALSPDAQQPIVGEASPPGPAHAVREPGDNVRPGSFRALSRSQTVAAVCTGSALTPEQGSNLEKLTIRTSSL